MEKSTERILAIMYAKGISGFQLAKDTGLAKNIVPEWKSGRIKPTADALQKVAQYLGVTTDYLLGVPPTEIQRLYDALPPERQAQLIAYAEQLFADYANYVELSDNG
jgi:transcriptional regulator with XRE-family HTH domain